MIASSLLLIPELGRKYMLSFTVKIATHSGLLRERLEIIVKKNHVLAKNKSRFINQSLFSVVTSTKR